MGEDRKEIEMTILGLGGISRDAACALLQDGRIAAAVEESKISRHSMPGSLPSAAIVECLRLGSAEPAGVDYVALAKPVAAGPQIHAQLSALFPNARLIVVEHQTAHAASAYYVSGFESATVVTLDRTGDFRCGARYRG